MPFPAQQAREFALAAVQAIEPGQMGCYGIYNRRGEWVYVGHGDIRQCMLAHVNGDNPCISRNDPAYWVSLLTSDHASQEKRLIEELMPICNLRSG